MAFGSLFALFDDIATILDDVAAMSKLAAKKTAGVLGDDLALNAAQVSGVRADRELPVVWAVAKGSLLNKAILVPVALLISAFLPRLVLPLLVVGGLYLCFEGAEKILHKFLHPKAKVDEANVPVIPEKEKIRGAIRTDFVLSAEIVVIALGLLGETPLLTRILSLVAVAVFMTVFVYGLVALIVKMDDAGLWLSARKGRGLWRRWSVKTGGLLLRAAPVLMRVLSWVGTVAMFLVGGGLLVHGIGPLHHGITAMLDGVGGLSTVGPALRAVVSVLTDAFLGVASGVLLVGVLVGWKKVRWRFRKRG